MTTLVMNKTSNLGKVVSRGLIAFAMGVWAFGESAGRARAAAELHRLGYTEEAKALMLGENK